MNAEQKQQAKQLIADWTNVSRTSTPAVWFLNGDCMAGFLQELIDAPEPEPEPVGYTNETELDYVRTYEALPVSGAFWPTSDEDACVALYTAPPANNQSDQHLEMVNQPALSVPDADLARDAERYRWLSTHGLQRAWVSLGTDFEGDNFASFRCEFNLPEPPNLPYEDDEGLQWADKDFDAAIDAAIAAEKGGAA